MRIHNPAIELGTREYAGNVLDICVAPGGFLVGMKPHSASDIAGLRSHRFIGLRNLYFYYARVALEERESAVC